MQADLVPVRTDRQRMEALRRAQEVRCRRADLKRDLRAGQVDPLGLLADPPEYLVSMKVQDLLVALPKIGRVRCWEILRDARVSPSKTLGGLSDRQRHELRRLVAGSSWRLARMDAA